MGEGKKRGAKADSGFKSKKRRNTGRQDIRGALLEDEPQPSTQAEFDSEVEESEQETEETQINAYDALLTLLKPEETKPKRNNKAKSRSSENEPGAIEGFEDRGIEDEEDEEDEVDENDDTDEIQAVDDNEGDDKDPFEKHFAHPVDDVLSVAANGCKFKSSKSRTLGQRSHIALPTELSTAQQGAINDLSKVTKVKNLDSLKLKYRLRASFTSYNGDFSDLQKEFASPVFAYQDVMYPLRSYQNATELQKIYALHSLNHIYKTRDRILKNNEKLSSNQDGEYPDQGFTRPKVLVILPTRDACWKFVNCLEKASGLNQSENKKRFKDAFYANEFPPESKPEDFRELFHGNTDDMFCLGIKFTRQAMKLYSSFYSSDLIVASSLGLSKIVGNPKKEDYDFLSSIELCVVDQADAIAMQNWAHVDTIFKKLNLLPKQSHGCDISRLRRWYVDDKAKFLRQTIILSQYQTPAMRKLFNAQCKNIGGKLMVEAPTAGVLGKVGTVGDSKRIGQVFTRIHAGSPVEDPDVRFKSFTSNVLPSLQRGDDYSGTLVFIPNFEDFVRVRRYVEKEKIDCTTVCEYDQASHISRARSYFAQGRVKILFITERFHHYRRFEIKGVKRVIMYGVPVNPQFYVEVMRFLVRTSIEEAIDPDMLQGDVYYTQYDSAALQRIVGSSRIGELMIGSEDKYQFN